MNAQAHDPQLWNIARDRAHFKVQLVRFVLVSALLWTIWYLTGHRVNSNHIPWPAWIMLFWGIGLVIKGVTIYGLLGSQSWSEREYQQLLRDREQKQ